MKRTLVLLMIVLTAACGSDSDTPPRDEDSSNPLAERGGEWRLVSGTGPEGPVEPIEDHPITLFVEADEVSGSAGCNQYGGSARVSGSGFKVTGGLAMTEIGCRPPVHEVESAYVEALNAAERMRLADEELVLYGRGTELRFEWVKPPQTADLTGTRWKLEALTTGDGPDGVASSAEPAWLLLDEGGELKGSTGCRRFDGSWSERGAQVQVTSLSLEGECPKKLRDQDSHVIAAIGDGFTFEVEGRELRVRAPRGSLGLVYRTR